MISYISQSYQNQNLQGSTTAVGIPIAVHGLTGHFIITAVLGLSTSTKDVGGHYRVHSWLYTKMAVWAKRASSVEGDSTAGQQVSRSTAEGRT